MITRKQFIFHAIDALRYWLFLIAIISLFCVLMCGCRSQAEIAAHKAAIESEKQKKEALKQENARQAEIITLLNMRKTLPCDSSRVVPGKTIYIPGEKIPCPDGEDSVQCPPCKSRTPDTVYIADPALSLVAEKRLKSAEYWHNRYRDSTNKMIANLSHANAIYKKGSDKWDRLTKWILIVSGIFAAGGIIFAFFKFKSKIGL